MRENHTTDERHCTKTKIIDRIRAGYPPQIRSGIYLLAKRLLQECCSPALAAAIVASQGSLLANSKQNTFADIFEEVEELEEDNTSDFPDGNFGGEGETDNKVLSQINLNDWEIVPPHEDLPTDTEFGILYDRYSSDNQKETGCIARVKSMLSKAAERNIPLYENPIVDVAETGKDTDREGIEKVVRLLQHPQVKYLFVHDVNRLGRRNSFCIFMVDLFSREFDIEVVTIDGILDHSHLQGLATTWVKSMAGEIENRNKATNTLAGQIENFEKGNYDTFYQNIKIGYEESDDDLLAINEEEIEVARRTFEIFAKADDNNAYKETMETIDSNYGEVLDGGEDKDDGKKLTRYRLKAMLTDPLYIGKPTVEGESIGDQGQQSTLDKPNLQIIDEDLFDRVNEKVDRIEEKYSTTTSPGDVMDLEYLLHEYGLIPMAQSSPRVAVICPECNSEMVRNNKSTLNETDRLAPVYKCLECAANENNDNQYKTFPNNKELYQIRLFDEILDNLEDLAQCLDLNAI